MLNGLVAHPQTKFATRSTFIPSGGSDLDKFFRILMRA